MVDDSGFIVNLPKSVVAIPNSDNVITNEVTHEKRFDSDGIPRRLIQRQSLKDSHTLETSQFICRDEIRDKSGTITEVIEQEYINDLETGHERLKVTIKNAKGQPNVTVEKNRIQDQDGNYLEKQEVLDNKSKVIRRSELVIQPDPQSLFSTKLRQFTSNKTNYWLLYNLKRKSISSDILNEKQQIFLGTHNELIYSDQGRLISTLEITRHLPTPTPNPNPDPKDQPLEIIEILLKKDKKGFLIFKEELRYQIGDFDGKIVGIWYKKMGEGEKGLGSSVKKIRYDDRGMVVIMEEEGDGEAEGEGEGEGGGGDLRTKKVEEISRGGKGEILEISERDLRSGKNLERVRVRKRDATGKIVGRVDTDSKIEYIEKLRYQQGVYLNGKKKFTNEVRKGKNGVFESRTESVVTMKEDDTILEQIETKKDRFGKTIDTVETTTFNDQQKETILVKDEAGH